MKKIFNVITKIKKNRIKKRFGRTGDNFDIATDIALIGGQYISVGNNFLCGARSTIGAWDTYASQKYTPEILIGDNVRINSDLYITAINRITIGNNVLLGRNILITDNSHGSGTEQDFQVAPSLRKLCSKGEVHIEDNVWIGNNAVVLPNVTIGESSIIGANSVVTKNIPPKSVAVGNPAHIVVK
ncbi:acyltransferase [Lactococcus fujiensis]|uniref:Acetyltransferase n=1 Tax=Lactococcus fujiensis JCM 16395 TaxID=1291764 RepID=A0A2A5RPR4_9LACT|nr:acyltransferase [Lactococcus fujiensis]PCS01433.1 hypothetical protein RT41_GL000197 [Lactococcus fujiensis JCM 16395]